MNIRPASSADIAAAKRLSEVVFSELRTIYHPSPLAKLRQTGPPYDRLVAIENDAVVGTVRYRVEDGCMALSGLAVSPENRCQGIARRLVRQVEAIAVRTGCRKLALLTVAETGNVAVFQRLGFEPVSMSAAQYSLAPDGRPLTEVYMERVVGNESAAAIEVRKATPTDAPRIAVVHVVSERAAYRGLLPDVVLDCLSEREHEAAWRERIGKGNSTTLVAGKDADVWGWINFGESRDCDAAPGTGEIRAMYVKPETWRRGVGTMLWEEANRFLRQAGYREVTLWVYAQNQLARRFYEKVGFRLEGDLEKNVDRGGEAFSAVRYRCTIQGS